MKVHVKKKRKDKKRKMIYEKTRKKLSLRPTIILRHEGKKILQDQYVEVTNWATKKEYLTEVKVNNVKQQY